MHVKAWYFIHRALYDTCLVLCMPCFQNSCSDSRLLDFCSVRFVPAATLSTSILWVFVGASVVIAPFIYPSPVLTRPSTTRAYESSTVGADLDMPYLSLESEANVLQAFSEYADSIVSMYPN